MSEEEKPKGEPKATEEDNTTRNKSEADNILEQIREERERLVKERELAKAEADRLTNLRARDMLGGSTEGGKPDEKPREESALEYSKKVMSGGLNEKPREEA